MERIIAFLDNVGAIIISITALIVAFKKAKNELIPPKVKKQSNINMEITDLLEQMKEVFKADRVQIYDFHNGGHYANGRSALKCSCTFEVVRTSVKGFFKELQGIHLQMIPHFIHELLSKEEMIVNDIEEIKNMMPATYEFKKNQSVGAFYDIILKNKQGEPIGFIGVQYLETNSIYIEKSELLKFKYLIEQNLEKMR